MSKRTEALRPAILLTPKETAKARQMRRSGLEPDRIAELLEKPLEEVEKALVQMRMPRPETTRGTLNVTLAAHRLVLRERRGDEPLWKTFDRMMDELLRLRAAEEARSRSAPERAPASRRRSLAAPPLPLLPGLTS